MISVAWVDQTYLAKHDTSVIPPSDRKRIEEEQKERQLRGLYYPNLKQYPTNNKPVSATSSKDRGKYMAVKAFLYRSGRRAALSLGIYLLTFVPYIGRFVLPAASFYSLNKAAGPIPAAVVFATGLFIPRRYLVVVLQSYFSSRSLMRELLEPYFTRIPFTKQQKAKWFRDREGLLFGFGVGFYILMRTPIFGVLIYGIAEASTAYLITKITDPPPPNPKSKEILEGRWQESQIKWRNKHEFLKLPVEMLDKLNAPALNRQNSTEDGKIKGRKESMR